MDQESLDSARDERSGTGRNQLLCAQFFASDEAAHYSAASMHRIDEPHPFSLETATLHYAEDRAVAAQHLALELDLDFEKHALSGVATHSLIALRSLKQLSFDAVDLDVSKVEVDGKSVDFDNASGEQSLVSGDY